MSSKQKKSQTPQAKHSYCLFEKIEIHSVVNRVAGISLRTYHRKRLVKTSQFGDMVRDLCVNQVLTKDSAATLCFVFNYKNYQTAIQIAGFVEQRMYLFSNYLVIHCNSL